MLSSIKLFSHIKRIHLSTFISLCTHILILSLGTTFLVSKKQRFHSVEAIVINTNDNTTSPMTAKFQAQKNSHGGGSTTEGNNIIRSFVQYAHKNSDGTHKKQEKSSTSTSNLSHWVTRSYSMDLVFILPSTHPREQHTGQGYLNEDLKKLLKAIKAQLHKMVQVEQSEKKRLFVGITAKKASHAEYINSIAERIEKIGSSNFPVQARNHPFSIIVTISIQQNGTLEKIRIDRGSGSKDLDESALTIIRKAFPSYPFPPDIRKDYSAIDMTRTIYFEPRTTEQPKNKHPGINTDKNQ